MEKEFVTYELAVKLKKLGFDEPCFGTWDRSDKLWTGNPVNGIWDIPEGITLAPLYQQAFKWFRENHGLDYEIPYAGNKGEYHAFVEKYVYGNNRNNPSVFSYDDAQQECLIKLIEIVENK
jgi:hypothetical protein